MCVFFLFRVFRSNNRKKELGGGTVLDLAVYTIQIAQLVFQQAPLSIEATGKLNDEGVDLEVNMKLVYGDNKIATMKTSALNELGNQAKIVGTKGEIVVRRHLLI